MPIATPEAYADMIRRAKEGGFAYPAINCTSSETINAALRGFADAGSDGIIQFSTGGAEFASGTRVKEMVTGAVALAEFAHVVAEELGLGEGAKPFNLVFHGGSGSDLDDIREAISYGVVKMNVDTDTQYAFTRPIAGHMFANYDGVLKIDGEVGNKKAYDPRSYLKAAETGMAERVVRACEDLLSAGQSQEG